MPTGILLLPRRHAYIQPVLRRRQRTGGIGRESARRVPGLVEIEDQLAVLRQRGVEKTRRPIRFLATGAIGKNKEQRIGFFLDRVQLERVAVADENRLARHLLLVDTTKDVADLQLMRRIERDPVGDDAP